ncbi:hypothetical protein PM082_014156 [Marasmius tenuissimus]|nr:hypothetical protein PM082_014156 [Marasmius tenuissimus]
MVNVRVLILVTRAQSPSLPTFILLRVDIKLDNIMLSAASTYEEIDLHAINEADIVLADFGNGQHLFKPRASATWSTEQYYLARIFATSYTKPLPPNVMDFFRRGQYFTLRNTFMTRYTYSSGLRISEEAEAMGKLLRAYKVYTPELHVSAMLQVLQDDRPSAKDLLACDWLREEVFV